MMEQVRSKIFLLCLHKDKEFVKRVLIINLKMELAQMVIISIFNIRIKVFNKKEKTF
jgi:hypothetical protein